MDRLKSDTALSYKFQRLREKLREAITNGELAGKLPGERALAKRFHANAKTMSKALTDLAAEGLLDRIVGRGTFVKGSAPSGLSGKRWLVLCDPQHVTSDAMLMLSKVHPDFDISTDLTKARPSYINQFSAVIDMDSSTPDALIRELVVRNLPVVVVGCKPTTYSTHSVQCDYPLAISMAGRDLMLAGHVRIAAVEPQASSMVAATLRSSAARYAPNATIDACFPTDVPAMIENGVTAFVCASVDLAEEVKARISLLESDITRQISLMAVGLAPSEPPCSGYYIGQEQQITAIQQLLSDTSSNRPTTIWLTARFVDRFTVTPVKHAVQKAHPQFHDVVV
jgi:hypothetical protein